MIQLIPENINANIIILAQGLAGEGWKKMRRLGDQAYMVVAFMVNVRLVEKRLKSKVGMDIVVSLRAK